MATLQALFKTPSLLQYTIAGGTHASEHQPSRSTGSVCGTFCRMIQNTHVVDTPQEEYVAAVA